MTIASQFEYDMYNRHMCFCAVRNGSCPADAAIIDFPCSDTGDCVYNATLQTTRCQCPLGLRGYRCEAGKDGFNSNEILLQLSVSVSSNLKANQKLICRDNSHKLWNFSRV